MKMLNHDAASDYMHVVKMTCNKDMEKENKLYNQVEKWNYGSKTIYYCNILN